MGAPRIVVHRAVPTSIAFSDFFSAASSSRKQRAEYVGGRPAHPSACTAQRRSAAPRRRRQLWSEKKARAPRCSTKKRAVQVAESSLLSGHAARASSPGPRA